MNTQITDLYQSLGGVIDEGGGPPGADCFPAVHSEALWMNY